MNNGAASNAHSGGSKSNGGSPTRDHLLRTRRQTRMNGSNRRKANRILAFEEIVPEERLNKALNRLKDGARQCLVSASRFLSLTRHWRHYCTPPPRGGKRFRTRRTSFSVEILARVLATSVSVDCMRRSWKKKHSAQNADDLMSRPHPEGKRRGRKEARFPGSMRRWRPCLIDSGDDNRPVEKICT